MVYQPILIGGIVYLIFTKLKKHTKMLLKKVMKYGAYPSIKKVSMTQINGKKDIELIHMKQVFFGQQSGLTFLIM